MDDESYKAMRAKFEAIQFEDKRKFVFTVTTEDGIDLPAHLAHLKGHCYKTGVSRAEYDKLKPTFAKHCKWFEYEEDPHTPIYDEDEVMARRSGKKSLTESPEYSTPDFSSEQKYLSDPPTGVGANRLHASTIPGRYGAKVKVFDIELGIHGDHEDRAKHFMGTVFGTSSSFQDHGAAVAGIVCGNNENGIGINGIAPEVEYYFIANTAGLTRSMIEVLKLVDPNFDTVIVFIELEFSPMPEFGVEYEYVPPTQYSSVRDTTRLLTDQGIHVFFAAANGSTNLDDPRFGGVFHEDCGQIVVGAGHPDTHVPLPFSGYGSAVHVQGHGYWVTTTGYGNRWNGGYPNRAYTDGFNGTSSGLPMPVACAAITLAMAIAKRGYSMTPRELRQFLINTGTPQGASDRHIGPLPNLLKIASRFYKTPDYNFDGWVRFDDFIQFAALYHAGDPAADLNNDGKVDFNDFLVFAQAFNGPAKWVVMQGAKLAIKAIDTRRTLPPVN